MAAGAIQILKSSVHLPRVRLSPALNRKRENPSEAALCQSTAPDLHCLSAGLRRTGPRAPAPGSTAPAVLRVKHTL